MNVPGPEAMDRLLVYDAQDRPLQICEWRFEEEISSGQLSRVFFVRNVDTGELCVGKMNDKAKVRKRFSFDENDSPYSRVEREIRLLASRDCAFVHSIIEAIDDERTTHMILPYAQNGSLQSLLDRGPIPERTLAICFYQVARALDYLHGSGVVHRDVKPDNVLCFDETYFVLSDFSAASELTDTRELLSDTQGSPAFLSPEECEGAPFDGRAADVWAYGVSLWLCVFGAFPFGIAPAGERSVINTVMAVGACVTERALEFPDAPVDPDLRAILTAALEKDPARRSTSQRLIESPWFAPGREVDERIEMGSPRP